MPSKNLFRNASLRLTFIYLSIIMVISLLFSVNSYVTYSRETESNIRRPLPAIMQRNASTDQIQEFVLAQQEFLEGTRNAFRNRLIILNLLILFGGGSLSYYLARRTLKPIEEAHEAQSRFTADASHELRTPIAAMRLETELTLTEPRLTLKHAKTQLKSSIEELDKLTALTEGMLKLARLQETELDKQPAQIKTIIDTASERIRKNLAHKSQRIDIHMANPSTEVNINHDSIAEALVTVLDNAVKYSPNKSTIQIATKSQFKDLEISVKDSGDGIAPSDMPYIFDRFYRSDQSRTKKHVDGYGIGLSIAKANIEANKGSIKAESKLGKGSTFTISLPLS